ncbi:HNH endonuclease [Corallococcus exiguus]|uniref:HNH endonuclease n=1 Tax=Corallococcus exiguus TaxID=83462 RepID=UPI001A8CC3ED|nr:HNH endonuclease [Corallococcus exiguus]MBN8469003.1 HNH endonuclease [Corallococcus exiguus]
MPNLYETRIDEDGYREVFLPFHPNSFEGWVKEHRLVMEVVLGLRLPGNIHVHHRDTHPSNNAVENLLLCPDKAVHTAIHSAINANDTARIQAGEQMCRNFELGVKVLAEKLRPDCFDAIAAREAVVVDKAEVSRFLKSLPGETQKTIADELRRLPPAPQGKQSAREAVHPRELAPLRMEERALIQLLSKKGATPDIISALIRRSAESIDRELLPSRPRAPVK